MSKPEGVVNVAKTWKSLTSKAKSRSNSQILNDWRSELTDEKSSIGIGVVLWSTSVYEYAQLVDRDDSSKIGPEKDNSLKSVDELL